MTQHARGSRAAGGRPQQSRRGHTTLLVVLAVGLSAAAAVAGARWVGDELAADTCEFRTGDLVERLTPEQAANAATISVVAVDRGIAPRAATVALATAIQESKLRNLSYGDADSLGLFQQRPSQGWGSPAEVQDPVYATNRFYDALVQVDDWRDGEVTVVAQAVQRSAYPDAYADHEAQARVLAVVLTGEAPGGLTCRVGAVEETASGSAQEVLDKAQDTFAADGAVVDDTVVILTDSTPRAWATASWAVAHAEVEDVTSVTVAGRRWTRDDEPLTWRDADPAVAATDPTTVTITVG